MAPYEKSLHGHHFCHWEISAGSKRITTHTYHQSFCSLVLVWIIDLCEYNAFTESSVVMFSNNIKNLSSSRYLVEFSCHAFSNKKRSVCNFLDHCHVLLKTRTQLFLIGNRVWHFMCQVGWICTKAGKKCHHPKSSSSIFTSAL